MRYFNTLQVIRCSNQTWYTCDIWFPSSTGSGPWRGCM